MKRFADQNFYEILEIPHNAAPVEIKRAYEIARQTFGPENAVSSPLFEASDRAAILRKVEEAFRTLIDPVQRKRYDEALALVLGNPAPQEKPAAADALPTGFYDQEEILGSELKAVRERMRISLSQIAETTRITLRHLECIEEDNFRSLPPETYIRSYLGQYARALGLDSEKVIQKFLARFHRWKREEGREITLS